MAAEIITEQPALRCGERPIAITDLSLSDSEDAAGWTAEFALTDLGQFLALKTGDRLDLAFYGAAYALIVDSLDQDRAATGDDGALQPLTLRVSGVSPVMRRRPTVTRTWSDPTDARGAVEELIGPVSAWEIPHWTIPAGRLAADMANPLDLARQVVAAAGGVIVSEPGGDVRCVPRFAIRVPDYQDGPVAAVLDDSDILQARVSLTPVAIVNRLEINDGQSGDSLQIDYEAVEGRDRCVTIRIAATADPAEPVDLFHAGAEDLALSPMGAVERTETELVTIEQGKGQTRFPVWSIGPTEWRYTSVGKVRAAQTGSRQLLCSGTGSSLLLITYVTRAWTWQASNPRDEDVLFLASELGGASGNIRVPFGSAASAGAEPYLSIEVDSRPRGLNGGKSSFAPGDIVYFLVFASGVSVSGFQASVGDLFQAGYSGGTDEREDEVSFGYSDTASLSVPADGISSVQWLGASLGALTLQADRRTLKASWRGTAVAKVRYTAKPTMVLGLRAPSVVADDVEFTAAVSVLGG